MIIYTTYQPWCTIDIKPGMRSEFVEEACETKLVYLGDNFFDELKRKPLTMTSWPQVNIDDIQAARILHRDANLMEMYIEHAASTEFNVQNANVVRNVQTFLSPSDTTTILPSVPTMFDIDYIPENKVEPDIIDTNTMFTLMESLGSNLGEISFPSTVKDEPTETVGHVLSTHLPMCQLRCGLETKLETLLSAQKDTVEQEPSPTEGYSSEETILLTPVMSPTGDAILSSQDGSACSQDVTSFVNLIATSGQGPDESINPVIDNSLQDITSAHAETSQEVTGSQELTNTRSICVTDTADQSNPVDVISICPIETDSSQGALSTVMDINVAGCATAEDVNPNPTPALSDYSSEVSETMTLM